MDFNADHTIVWSTDCQTKNIGNFENGPCDEAPVLAINGFDGSPLPEQVGTFSYARFGGYSVSGTMFTSKLCFGQYNCKFVTVYGVDQVEADNWLYGTDATYGTIGMGPNSFIWEGFVDPQTKTATYSIELGKISFYSDE